MNEKGLYHVVVVTTEAPIITSFNTCKLQPTCDSVSLQDLRKDFVTSKHITEDALPIRTPLLAPRRQFQTRLCNLRCQHGGRSNRLRLLAARRRGSGRCLLEEGEGERGPIREAAGDTKVGLPAVGMRRSVNRNQGLIYCDTGSRP